MSDNYNRDDIPVQDVTEAHRTKSLAIVDKEIRMALSSSNIRRGDEFQDRIHQLTDENLFLKKYTRKCEDKSKQLEAKLSRILSEKKYVGRKDEYEAEESRHRIIELEYQVGMLKDRLQVAKQQLVSYTKIFPPHSNSRINKTKQSGKSSTSNSSVGVHLHAHGTHPQSYPNSELAEQFEVLLVEAKVENQGLENQLQHVRDQLRSTQRELGSTKELLQIKEIAHEDEISLLRAQLGDTDQTKKKLSDNIQLIRLQRDSRRASSWLTTLETQCKTLEANLSTSQETCQQLEAQLNTAQEELREVQQQNLNLNKQVEDNLAEISKVKELEAQITSLKEENGILKEANDSLQAKAVSSSEKVRKVENEEATLKAQISQMELTIKKEILSKTDLYSDVTREKNKCMTLTETLNDLKKKFSAMEVELKRLERSSPGSLSVVTFLEPGRNSPAGLTTSESTVFDESARNSGYVYGERLQVPGPGAGQGQGQGQVGRVSSISDTCVVPMGDPGGEKPSSPCLYCQTLEKDLVETRSSMGKLQDDLIKTKNLLKGQMATNRECHKEIEILGQKLEKADKFHHEKLQEFMKVLEERAVQMIALEKKFELVKNQSRVSPEKTKALVSAEVQVNGDSRTSVLPISVPVPAPAPVVPVPVPVPPTRQPQAPPSSSPPLPTEALKEKDVNANDQVQVDEVPSVEIFIDKFIPVEAQKQLVNEKNLFATWEFNDQVTKYSPIVRNGIFNSGSTHLIQDKQKVQSQIQVQIHQAIGPSDCYTIGKGVITAGKNSCLIQSINVPPEQLGELKYKFTVKGGIPLQTELGSAYSESGSGSDSQSDSGNKMKVKAIANPKVQIPEPEPASSSPETFKPDEAVVPKPKPKPRKASAPAPAPVIVAAEDSESSSTHSNSTYSISPKSSPKRSQRSKTKTKIDKNPEIPDPHTQSQSITKKPSKLTRDVKINDENQLAVPSQTKVPMPIPASTPMPVKTRSVSSPKKPILRRESSSPEIKKKNKRVTVTEIVEERKFSASTSDDNTNDEKYEKQRKAAEIATAAAAIAAEKIRRHQQGIVSGSSSDSSSGEMSGDNDGHGNDDEAPAEILVVQPKEIKTQGQDHPSAEKGSKQFQIPAIQVEGFDVDSSANSTAGETSIDLDVISPAEIVTVSSKGHGIKSKSKKHKLTMESTTELDPSSGSGSGSGDEGQVQGQGHLAKRTKPKLKATVPTPSSTELETESSTLVGENTDAIARRSKKPKDRQKRSSGYPGQDLEEDSFLEDSSSQDSETFKQTIRIEISHVVFNSPCRIWSDPKIKKIFVEYRFLDFNPEEMETPFSVAKPQPGKKAEFNFIKIFLIDTRERRKLLQTMLIEKRRIRFTVVSEPPENDSLDCEDIGYAYVPIAGLQKEDLVQEQLTIYDAENPRLEMGSIYVSIQARDVLRTL